MPVGVFVGFIVGGYVSTYYGWRSAFLAVGVPGVILALLVRFTLREPPRGQTEENPGATTAPPMREAITTLLRVPSYRHLVMASSIFTLGAVGSGIWIPSFFIRVHSMPRRTSRSGWRASTVPVD